jgi:molybdopterin-guanine dinucleotide biosynthesis protein A
MPNLAILSGGRSSRLGTNKALADLNGITVLEYILNRLQPHFSETFIVTNEPQLYAHYPARVITDIFPRKGPIAGIHAALKASSGGPLFVLSCDMLFVNIELVEYLFRQAAGYDAVVPVVKGYLQPTAAVYNQSCLQIMTDCLEKDLLKLTRVFEAIKTRYVDESCLSSFGPLEELFFNINDAAALQKARELARRH